MIDYTAAEERVRKVVIDKGKLISVELKPSAVPELALGFKPEPLPEYCRVRVQLNPEGESDIQVEVWLPINGWNGNFLGTGSGGSAGTIDPLSLTNGLRRGFATANTDMGTAPSPDTMIGKPERWADFGHRATHLMTVVAKQIILAFYSVEHKYAYFMGCSTGGQQALMEAQRYPEDYDGILAMAPANNRTNLHIAFVWNWLALACSPETAISPQQAAAVTQRVLDVYGPDAGLIPGDKFLMQPNRIKVDTDVFFGNGQPEVLRSAQREAMKKVYQGPVNPRTGERIFSPLVVLGSENSDLGIAQQSERDNFARDFFYLFRWIFGKDFDFEQFDFDRDVAQINEILAPVLNANNTDLTAFKKGGGKIIMVHGMADPIIPYTDSLNYYKKVIQAQGSIENTEDFFRYFSVPGYGHTLGGPGIHAVGGFGLRALPKDKEHDVLIALTSWVEKNIAPDRLLATAFKDGNLINGFTHDEYEYHRPVYPYPFEAVYNSGDPNQPDNYLQADVREAE